MKKLLVIGCFLLTACRSATVTQSPPPSLFPTSTPFPTPAPATQSPGPTASQTLEVSPTPLPRYFTNEFDSSLAGWVILQAGNESVPNISSENGSLLLQMDSPFTWLYTLYGPEEYDDVRIETQFQNRAGIPAAVGLVCRYGDEQGWFEYNVATDGTYNILYGKWLSAGIAEYLPVTEAGSSKLIQPGGATQSIGLACEGTILSLYVNDVLLRRVDVARFELQEGKVGVAASSFENVPVLAAIDWVRVGRP